MSADLADEIAPRRETFPGGRMGVFVFAASPRRDREAFYARAATWNNAQEAERRERAARASDDGWFFL